MSEPTDFTDCDTLAGVISRCLDADPPDVGAMIDDAVRRITQIVLDDGEVARIAAILAFAERDSDRYFSQSYPAPDVPEWLHAGPARGWTVGTDTWNATLWYVPEVGGWRVHATDDEGNRVTTSLAALLAWLPTKAPGIEHLGAPNERVRL